MLSVIRILVLLGLSLSAVVTSPTMAGWKSLGLSDRIVHSIALEGDFLFAATDSGVYRFLTTDLLPEWVPIGLSACDIRALLVLDLDTIFAGLEEGTVSIYRTTDGGASWLPFENGYGGGSFHPVLSFDRFPDQKNTLLATGMAVVAKSTDRGLSWQPKWGDWGGLAMGVVFVKVDRRNPQTVWAGGEGAFFNPWLFKSTDYGENWEWVSVVYTGDNRCHDIAIHPQNSDLGYVSMEGQVQKTTDGGAHWEIITTNGYYLYGIEIDSLRPNNLYVSAAQGTEPLKFFKSSDAGQSWNAIVDSTQTQTPAFDILLASRIDANIIYFATWHGVFQYTDSVSFLCGDVNRSGFVNIADAVFLIAYIFAGGPPPDPLESGDVNCNGLINIADVVYLIHYIFSGGPAPCQSC